MTAPVALKRYTTSPDSLRELLDLGDGLAGLTPTDHVLIKPNLVAWDRRNPLPLYGVYTTRRIVEDLLVVLREHGAGKITIAEGSVSVRGQDEVLRTPQIFEMLGYPELARKYDAELLDLLPGPFATVEAEGFEFEVAEAALAADFLIDVPVLKTHNQSKVSLGLKNLKGCLSDKSRKAAHSADHKLDHHLSLFAEHLTPALTVIDGIYSLERGPAHGGIAVRTDTLIASRDVLAADLVGAAVAGFDPAEIVHLRAFAARHDRSTDLADLELRGDPLADLARPLRWDSPWREDDTGPRVWDRFGITDRWLPKYDDSLCTGCSFVYGPILMMLMSATREGAPETVEVLTGKSMTPSGQADHTVLVGKCMLKKNHDAAGIRHRVRVRGCPPTHAKIVAALAECGLQVSPAGVQKLQGMALHRYAGQPEFDPGMFGLPPDAWG